MIGSYEVIDAHCHVYPAKIAAKAALATGHFYGLPPTCGGTVEELIRIGGSAGIDHYVVQSVATTPKQVRSINDFIAEEVANSGGRLYGLGTLHPASDDIAGDLRHLLSLGLHGVKLHPDIQDFKIDDYRCLKIYELCERDNVPILMHTGDNRYDRSNPNRLRPIMEIYTGLTVVAAHLGGYSLWEQACAELRDIPMPRLYVDCSSSMPCLPGEVVRQIIRSYGADRVLFGTDYPLWSPAREVENFLALGLEDWEYRRIFSETAREVFRLGS